MLQEQVIEREINRVLDLCKIPPGDESYQASIVADVRKRLSARATLGDVGKTYVCPAGHSTSWDSVSVVFHLENGARRPIVFLQCPECVEVKSDATAKEVEGYVETSASFLPSHFAWIEKAADDRIKEIDTLIGGEGLTDKERDAMLSEKKIAAVVQARAAKVVASMFDK